MRSTQSVVWPTPVPALRTVQLTVSRAGSPMVWAGAVTALVCRSAYGASATVIGALVVLLPSAPTSLTRLPPSAWPIRYHGPSASIGSVMV